MNEANAMLIAAAPDLLAALEYALPYLRAVIPVPMNGPGDPNCIERAESAIAKATNSR